MYPINDAYKKGTPELKGLSPAIAVRPTFLDGTKTAGLRDYELTDHLSNVMAVISDRKLSVDMNSDTITDYYAPQVVSFTDYYPFGFPMAERSGNLSGYRFGFNGQEADGEIYGVKTTYAFEYRMQDTRLGRFWSVDPLVGDYPWNSAYAFAENRVIDGIELEGLEIVLFTENQGVGHTFIAVFTEKGVTAYTYGRYMGSYIPFLGAYAPIGKGVLLKYEGENANVYIRAHFEKGPSAKAYLIPSVNNDKVKKYYEYLYNSGTDLPEFIEKDGKMEKNPYYKYGKFIDTYLLIGNSCVTKTNEALKEGGFNLTQEAMPTNPPLILVSPNEVQLLIDIIMRTDAKKENENPRVYDVTNDVKKW